MTGMPVEGLVAVMPCRLDRRSPCLLHVELVLEEFLGFLRVE